MMTMQTFKGQYPYFALTYKVYTDAALTKVTTTGVANATDATGFTAKVGINNQAAQMG